MPAQIVVGVCGYAQSGKDTVAAYLVQRHQFVRRAFADALREDMAALNPFIGHWYDDMTGQAPLWRYAEAIERWGYETAKAQFTELRQLLQRYGTEVHRDRDPDCWINRHREWVQNQQYWDPLADSLIVVPDVRFPNEANYVNVLIRVERPGVGPVNAHISDNMIDKLPANFVVTNDGTVEDLWEQVEATRLAW